MSKLSKDEVLHKLYYDVETGFGSVNELYKQANKTEASFILKKVGDWLKNNLLNKRKDTVNTTVIQHLSQDMNIS